jgi:hypothetical protein
MGLFDLLTDVIDVAEKTVRTGAAVVADVTTFGGELTDKDGMNSYTEDALEELGDSLDKLTGG